MTTLTARTALQIAAQYGFSIRDGKWEHSLIRDSIIQARDASKSPCQVCDYNGSGSCQSWACPRRRKSAEQYFAGYMADTAAEIYGEAMKGRDFERNAYGEAA